MKFFVVNTAFLPSRDALYEVRFTPGTASGSPVRQFLRRIHPLSSDRTFNERYDRFARASVLLFEGDVAVFVFGGSQPDPLGFLLVDHATMGPPDDDVFERVLARVV